MRAAVKTRLISAIFFSLNSSCALRKTFGVLVLPDLCKAVSRPRFCCVRFFFLVVFHLVRQVFASCCCLCCIPLILLIYFYTEFCLLRSGGRRKL